MPTDQETLPRRERERAMHRQAILDAAIKVFGSKGYFNATLDDVAAESEFSKGGIYLYFANKEELLYTILEEAFKFWDDFAAPLITGTNTFREELTRLFKEISRSRDTNPRLHNLLSAQKASLYRALSEEKRQEMMRQHDRMLELLGERVRQAIASNELRDIPHKTIVGIILGSLDGMVHNRWGVPDECTMDIAIDSFMDVLFNGISRTREE